MTHTTELDQIASIQKRIKDSLHSIKQATNDNKAIADSDAYYETSGALDDIDTHLFDAIYNLQMAEKAVNALNKEAMQNVGINSMEDVNKILEGWADE